MDKDANYFYDLILKTKGKPVKGYSTYGSNVMPVLKIFKDLKSFEERKGFQDALEKMLEDEDPHIRRFAITICLGFFVFKDAI